MLGFQMVSNVSLNEIHTSRNRFIWFILCVVGVIMYMVRLNFLMKSGQRLGREITESKRALEELLSQIPQSKINEKEQNRMTLLKNRLDIYQFLPPITPYSVFSLNNRTFYATLATMITYMVALLKLRGTGNSSDIQPLHEMTNVTLPV